MASSIQELSEIRKEWVEINRKNRFEDGIKRLLTDLYPDNAHFIYELLQNAEDARASVVRFILNNDSVEFEHNGDRLFSIEDVDSITSFGVSTKKDDPTSIGKFGVGFKAVFAYTTTPEIESGEYHFRIRDLFVPDTDGLASCALGEKETRMIFPFDNPRKPPEMARAEIERNLRQLNESTLLFLSNIRKIEYLLPDSTLGFLERTEPDGNRIEISVKHPKDWSPASAVFLRFEKEADVNDEYGKPKSCRIAVAFSMEKIQEQDTEKSSKQGKQPLTARWRIKPLDPGQVSIYFPADKETSKLRFHLHAPFASTVARDSVRDCSANNELRDHLANLIAESMAAIRDQGLLMVGFLATLPNDKDNLSSFYKPIQDGLIKAFQNEELTPMKQGGYAAANRIFRGAPQQLSNLISDDDLATILGKDYFPPMWVANPPQRSQREDNFLSMLNISEWTTENLVSTLFAQSEPIIRWLAEKTDEWHQQLYALLGGFLSNAPSSPSYEARNRKEKLTGLRIVRISGGIYSIGSKCYFPSDGVEHDDLMPCVAKGVYTSGKDEQQQKKAKEFLEAVGVREVGEAEQVEAILKDRYSQEAFDREAFNPRMEDIKRFVSLVEKDPWRANLFEDRFIFKLTDEKWGKPRNVYLDSPFYDTGLFAYYGDHGGLLGTMFQCWALSQDYKECGISLEKIGEFAKKVGSKTILDIKENKDNHSIDYTIDLLDDVLRWKSLPISKLIWKTLAEHERNSTVNYLQRSKIARKYCYPAGDSDIITKLKGHQWIPQRFCQGDQLTFVKPADADSKFLPDGFSFDNGWKWVNAVAFSSSVRQREEAERRAAQRETVKYQHTEEAVKSLGFGSVEEAKEMAELKQEDPEGFKKWRESNKEKPSFKDGLKNLGRPQRGIIEHGDKEKSPVSNPDRYQEKLNERVEVEVEGHQSTPRKITFSPVRDQPSNEEARRFLYEQYHGRCQITGTTFPKASRNTDGVAENYFEACSLLSYTNANYLNDAGNMLCVSADTMAKFKYASVEFIDSLENTIELFKTNSGKTEVVSARIRLAGEECFIKWSQRHFMRLVALYEKA